jgi:hypothetical protein
MPTAFRPGACRRSRFPYGLLGWTLLLVLPACGGAGGGGGGGGGGTPVGCAADPGGGCTAGAGTPITVGGTISYERLVLSGSGLGPGLQTRPARFVDVEVRAAGTTTCYGSGSTDATGAYAILVAPPSGTMLQVVAWSRTDYHATVNVTAHDDLAPSVNVHCNGDVFRHASSSFGSGSSTTVNLTVPYNPGTSSRPSIGFGLLDVLVTCSEAIRTTTGVVPPVCHAYTQLGNSGAVGTSFFEPSSNSITMLGGAAGNLDGSDTDYFDDGVIAHEYHHFVEFNLGHSLNRGGAHGGENLEPNFAWSEGASTGFGCLARGTPLYIDSFGTNGSLLFQLNVENVAQTARGIGSEETVEEIVWDLGDGGAGPASTDGDAVDVPLGGLYTALLSFDPSADAPFLGLFLQRLEAAGQATQAELALLSIVPENQQFSYPPSGADVFPEPLAIPGNDTGFVDSRAGAGINQCRGRASSAWYVVTLAAPDTIDVGLDIQPLVGVPNANLDLSLLGIDGTVLRRDGRGGSSDEALTNVALAAGRYLVLVEANCVGAGNAANFVLTVN